MNLPYTQTEVVMKAENPEICPNNDHVLMATLMTPARPKTQTATNQPGNGEGAHRVKSKKVEVLKIDIFVS
jgi:hypothetical protein